MNIIKTAIAFSKRNIFILYLIFILSIIISANMGWLSLVMTTSKQHWAYSDKLAHFLLVGGLAFLLHYRLVVRKGFQKSRIMKTTLLMMLIATLEETSQRFLANRSFNYLDMSANLLGILFFSVVIYFLFNKKTTINP